MIAPRHTRARPALLLALVAALSMVAVPAASAADTTTTFAVTAGGLAITAPAATSLGTAATTGSISAALGQIRVTDTRGALLGSYAATVSSTDFTTGGATAAETIAVANATYTGGVVTPSGAVVCASLLVASPLSSAAQGAMNATAATGTNSCTWNPTIGVALPAGTVAGTYTATITHSVA